MSDKTVCIRQAALEGFQNHFIDQAHAAAQACKEKKKRKENSQTMKNTYMGKGFCVDEDMECFKLDKEEKERKKAEKAAKNAEKEAQAVAKYQERIKDLEEAKNILRTHHNDRVLCDKYLRVKHVRALLHALGKQKEMHGLKRAPLLALYWTVHQDIPSGTHRLIPPLTHAYSNTKHTHSYR